MYGPIESAWRLDEKTITVDVEVPPNTTATVRLPSAKPNDVTEGGKLLTDAEGVTETCRDGDTAVICIGSGRYSFQYRRDGKV
jgi:alpha-L-rhamnosidase